MPHAEEQRIPLDKFTPAAPTKEELPYANLVTLDLHEFDKGPEAREKLAQLALESLHTTGFLYVVNHDVAPEKVQHQNDIANTLLHYTDEQKKAYMTTPEQAAAGRMVGFKSPELSAAYGLTPTLNYYNVAKLNDEVFDEMDLSNIPPVLRQEVDSIRDVTKYLHTVVMRKLLILIAIALKVPPHTFANLHTWESYSNSYLRYATYDPSTKENHEKYKDLFLPGHSDSSSMTFIFNQPSAGLQILAPGTQLGWEYVKYVEGTMVVNVGEGLSALTGGYLKPTIHRVVKPPADQDQHRRISLIYFARCFDSCQLTPPESPVLKELGFQKITQNMTMAEFAVRRFNGHERQNYDKDKLGRASLGRHDHTDNDGNFIKESELPVVEQKA
ncbi:Clavaminate synthase-like protein [Xylariaceae sp. FL0255]|nr:Clavaminate synthase-like protein [Xylariaceae sp. FL0255]